MGEAKANWEASVEKEARDTLWKDCIKSVETNCVRKRVK